MINVLRNSHIAAVLMTLALLWQSSFAQQVETINENKKVNIERKALVNDLADSAISGREEKFKKLMTGAKLTGLFTIEGKPLKDQVEDTYEIRKVEKKADNGDTWIITARVKYAKNDYEMPFPIAVKWAGDTPVLTLEKLAVPGLGTFSCRVVLHGTKYAGTWQHDKVGGHMFGNIVLPEAEKTDGDKKPE
ncbi:MAG: hypothetical protein U0930_22640 [Pirellulales bacterium]